MSKVQKYLANESGIPRSGRNVGPIPSASLRCVPAGLRLRHAARRVDGLASGRHRTAPTLRRVRPPALPRAECRRIRRNAGSGRPGAPADAARIDVLACKGFRSAQRTRIDGTDPCVRVDRETSRRADIVGTFPDDDATAGRAIAPRVGTLMPETEDEGAVARRAMAPGLGPTLPLRPIAAAGVRRGRGIGRGPARAGDRPGARPAAAPRHPGPLSADPARHHPPRSRPRSSPCPSRRADRGLRPAPPRQGLVAAPDLREPGRRGAPDSPQPPRPQYIRKPPDTLSVAPVM